LREIAIVTRAPEEVNFLTAMTTAVWRVGSDLIQTQISCLEHVAKGGIASKLRRVCWRRALVQEKGNRDNAAGKSYSNSISVVHRCE
jgi:hypothetical protein